MQFELNAKEKEDMLDSIGHDFKTPLTSIKGFSQLLTDETISSDSTKRLHYLDIISKNSDRLCETVQNLEIALRRGVL